MSDESDDWDSSSEEETNADSSSNSSSGDDSSQGDEAPEQAPAAEDPPAGAEGEAEEEEAGDQKDEGDDVQLTAAQLDERREANVRALVAGSLHVERKALLPKLLTVANAEAFLKLPFKSPHPNAPAASDALRRKLQARRQFVPWGAAGKFQAPKVFLPQREDSAAAAAAAEAVVLPPGIEPLVLWAPPPGEAGEPVVVDPMLTRWLRPHQREGVQFMFNCVAGLRAANGQGCILADDMGLGKTLQGIALLWTLLSGGHALNGGAPMARRVVICCPTSLVANWDSECVKWLCGRVRTLPLCESTRDEAVASVTSFLSPRSTAQVLIVSYETFRIHAERFLGEGAVDLLICDEAHRLKNDQTLTNKALDALACRRRVLLSGTPLQNHLDEFYALVSFANPGVLGTPSHFRRHYEAPILAGREPGASDAEAARGGERSSELSAIVNAFILRRTNALLSAHLPPKVVQVVCCRMTALQEELYCHFLQSKAAAVLLATQKASRVLSAITSLRKLLNHPKLIYDTLHSSAAAGRGDDDGGGRGAGGAADGFEGCARFFPPRMFDGGRPGRGAMPPGWEALSGKFAVLARMLEILRAHTSDRIVVVSNFTQTLDLIGQLCRDRSYPVLRLDGSTTIGKRQKLVARFCDSLDRQFVFLLSSKAGGCGLNLVGGNRLVLFDPDWNPANDKQAAGRVWRDGQTKRVYVYRFLTTGSIEEKVYQRQLSKEGLQAVVDGGNKGGAGGGGQAQMSMDQLRDLFTYDPQTLSSTYDSVVAGGTGRGSTAGGVAKRGSGGGGGEEEEEEEGGVVIPDSEEEESEDDWQGENGAAAAPPPAAAGPGPGSASAAAVAGGGTIARPQAGKPAEEDLRAWAHHSDAATVPDAVMQRIGGEHVSFVFSCSIEGRDVPPEKPLGPDKPACAAAQQQQQQHGGGGRHGGGGGLRHHGLVIRPAEAPALALAPAAALPKPAPPRPAAAPTPAAQAPAPWPKENAASNTASVIVACPPTVPAKPAVPLAPSAAQQQTAPAAAKPKSISLSLPKKAVAAAPAVAAQPVKIPGSKRKEGPSASTDPDGKRFWQVLSDSDDDFK